MKRALTGAPIPAYSRFKSVVDNPFSLQTDASNTGLRVVFTQMQDSEARVIAFTSRTLLTAERKYTVTECECLNVACGIRKFREYLEGFYLRVITDHSILQWLNSLRNLTDRPARWGSELQGYDFDIIHRKGALHYVPDALSRLTEEDETLVSSVGETEDPWYLGLVQAIQDWPKICP